MTKVFNEEHKKNLSQELEKLINDYLEYLNDYDDDEDTRCNRLYPLLWMKNLIDTNIIDRLTISEEEQDKIYC